MVSTSTRRFAHTLIWWTPGVTPTWCSDRVASVLRAASPYGRHTRSAPPTFPKLESTVVSCTTAWLIVWTRPDSGLSRHLRELLPGQHGSFPSGCPDVRRECVQLDPRHPQQFGTSGQADITLMVVGEDQIVWSRSSLSKTMPWPRNSPVRFGDASPHETSWLGGFLSKHIAGQTPGLWTARRSSILAVQRPRLTRLRISRKPSGVMP